MSRTVKHCKRCKKPATQARPISRRGNCPTCGVKAFKEAQRANAEGGIYADPEARTRWVEGMARAVERESASLEQSA